MTQNSTEFKASLTDEQIATVAKTIDQFFLDMGEQFSPTAIEFAAITLGRLMIFTKATGCFDTFSGMMEEVSKMKDPEPIFKQNG